jgi:peptidoglycan/xylan/chitin deacetylase (PgdA/CDA1 family)
MSKRLLILCWHNIDPTPAFPAPEGAGRLGFERQLGLLRRYTNVLSLPDVLDSVEAGEELPARAVVLTFDDGYRDALTVAVPLLDRVGLPATFFLVPEFLSGRLRPWWEDLADAFDATRARELLWNDRLHHLQTAGERRAAHDCLLPTLKRLDGIGRARAVTRLRDTLLPEEPAPTRQYFIDWAGARALLAAGHHVGSHSRSHAILSRERPADQADELVAARAELEVGLGTTVDTLAYPNGTADDYDEATIAHARAAGYRCGLTTRTGLATRDGPRYEMRRVVIGPTTDIASVVRAAARRAGARIRPSPATSGP